MLEQIRRVIEAYRRETGSKARDPYQAAGNGCGDCVHTLEILTLVESQALPCQDVSNCCSGCRYRPSRGPGDDRSDCAENLVHDRHAAAPQLTEESRLPCLFRQLLQDRPPAASQLAQAGQPLHGRTQAVASLHLLHGTHLLQTAQESVCSALGKAEAPRDLRCAQRRRALAEEVQDAKRALNCRHQYVQHYERVDMAAGLIYADFQFAMLNELYREIQREALSLHVNGEVHEVWVPVHRTLLEVLREDLGLTGTKHGCELGECGTCTVLVDGQPQLSCLLLPVQLGDREITTVEGMGSTAELHPLQRAFADLGAAQCGYCTPGILLAAKALLSANPSPDRQEIRDALAGNLCRCTGYSKIIEAVEAAAVALRE